MVGPRLPQHRENNKHQTGKPGKLANQANQQTGKLKRQTISAKVQKPGKPKKTKLVKKPFFYDVCDVIRTLFVVPPTLIIKIHRIK